jgi:hypothetical protein
MATLDNTGLWAPGKTVAAYLGARQAEIGQANYDGWVPAAGRIANYVPEKLLASAGLVDTFYARAKDMDRLVVLKVLLITSQVPDAVTPGHATPPSSETGSFIRYDWREVH